ncbi:hypothetical protein ASPCADRAFT_10668 [Aspergillus carbonarius ITEM 5010]|uniref:Uncharacterized protein n=1 Tax=Aspergillus carbonarius (strain ITEM 5010) TaxID=602072 RepID=A0A1R3R7E0_ASPC5|nr:hypothetical protein ASPCADRAFT_10668 [Aspergillus carbonarius ITEM 5010]
MPNLPATPAVLSAWYQTLDADGRYEIADTKILMAMYEITQDLFREFIAPFSAYVPQIIGPICLHER